MRRTGTFEITDHYYDRDQGVMVTGRILSGCVAPGMQIASGHNKQMGHLVAIGVGTLCPVDPHRRCIHVLLLGDQATLRQAKRWLPVGSAVELVDVKGA